MAFPQNGVLDNFNRADGGMGADWSNLWLNTAPNISSNAVVSQASTQSSAYWDRNTFDSDQEAYFTIPTLGAGCDFYIAGRINGAVSTSTANLYRFWIATNGALSLGRVDAGTTTTIASGSRASPAAGDAIGIEFRHNLINCWYKPSGGSWSIVLSAVDSTYMVGGYIGFSVNKALSANLMTIDDFGGGTIDEAVGMGFNATDAAHPVVSDVGRQFGRWTGAIEMGSSRAAWLWQPPIRSANHDPNPPWNMLTTAEPYVQPLKGTLPGASGTPSFSTSASLLDNFNRANGTGLGANWTAYFGDPSANIASNTAQNSGTGTWGGDYWNVANFGPDVEAFCTFSSIGTVYEFTLAVRQTGTLASTPSGYRIYRNSGSSQWEIDRIDSGSVVALGASITQAISVGDSVGIRCVGSTIEFWYKASGGSWSLLASRTDATYSSAGAVAFEEWSSTSGVTGIDNFYAGTVANPYGALSAIKVKLQAISGAITPAATLIKNTLKALAGALTDAATLSGIKNAGGGGTNYTQSVAGSNTPAATLIKQTSKILAGALTDAGVIIKNLQRALSGSNTPAGTIVKRTNQHTLTAGNTPSATIVKQPGKLAAGSNTPTGTLVKFISKLLSGGNTPAGVLVKQTFKSFAGALTDAGTLARQAVKSLAGTLSSAGTIVKNIGKLLSGGNTPSGTIIKQTNQHTLTGALTDSGVVSTIKTFLRTITGALTPAATLVKQTGKALSATQASSATLIKQTAKKFVGAITPSAVLAALKVAFKSLSGSLAPAGTLVNRTQKRILGFMQTHANWDDIAGEVRKLTIKTPFTASLSPSATLIKMTLVPLAAALGSSGSLLKSIGKSLSGSVSFLGILGTISTGTGNKLILMDHSIRKFVFGRINSRIN